jgi:hypothetical protein
MLRRGDAEPSKSLCFDGIRCYPKHGLFAPKRAGVAASLHVIDVPSARSGPPGQGKME